MEKDWMVQVSGCLIQLLIFIIFSVICKINNKKYLIFNDQTDKKAENCRSAEKPLAIKLFCQFLKRVGKKE